MLAFVVGAALVIGLIGVLIYMMGREDRYADMTEEEFRTEAEHAVARSSALLEVHNLIQARAAPVIREVKRAKQESSVSGDPPHDPEPPMQE